jgi:pimeloyl-ACP methyl ester carboxylesterase
MKKKIWKKVCIGVLAVIFIVLLISTINHQIRLRQEQNELQKYGVGEQIDVGGSKINIYTTGNNAADSTIVYMHGLGMGDTSVAARPMLEPFKQNFKICIVDRFGNGLSDDTNERQTVKSIVEQYRSILKNANNEAPYILIAHSISGIYATYWAQSYPEEVQAIIYLDADPVECFAKQGEADFLTLALAKTEYMASILGLQRFFVSDSTLIGQAKNQIYTDQQNTMRKYLMYRHTFSKATCSELELYYENAQTVLNGNMNFNIPQLYVAANEVVGDYYKNIYAQTLEERFKADKEKIRNKIDNRKQVIAEKISFMDKRSNIDSVEMSGPHCLYEYDPSGVADAIGTFLMPRLK